MGLITSIVENAAVAAATAAFPPLGWALKLLGGIESAVTWCFATWTRALITVAVLVLAIGGWYILHLRADLAAANTTIAQFKTAQKAAAAIAKQDNTQAVAAVAQLNGVTDHDYEDGLAVGKAQLAAWIAAHRVYPAPAAGAIGIAPAAAQDHPAGVSASPTPATAAVAISQPQLTIWDQTWQDDHDCRIWANAIAELFDGKHWPSRAEVSAVPTGATAKGVR